MDLNFRNLLLPMLLALMIAIGGCIKGNADNQPNSGAESDSTAETDSSAKAGDDKTNPSDKKGEDEVDLELVPVEVETAIKGDISQYLLLSASLKTEEQVAVFPEVGGIVRAFLVDEGDRVDEGDTLLILDHEEKMLNRDAALLDYQQSSAEYERAAELRNQNLISKEAFDKSRYDMERSRIRYERSELELRRTSVLAPISGYIAQRMVNRGDLVNMSIQLYSLVNPTDMIAEVHIPEAELPRVDHGKHVEVFSDVYPDRTFTANIKRISPVVDVASGTFRVTVGVHDEREILRPGMFVNVRIVTSVHHDVVLVPKEAVLYENDLPIVYVVQDSLALKVRLKAGFDDNNFIESMGYIQPGDTIVIVGQSGLRDSAKVKIIDMDKIRREALELTRANGERIQEKKAEKSGESDDNE